MQTLTQHQCVSGGIGAFVLAAEAQTNNYIKPVGLFNAINLQWFFPLAQVVPSGRFVAVTWMAWEALALRAGLVAQCCLLTEILSWMAAKLRRGDVLWFGKGPGYVCCRAV